MLANFLMDVHRENGKWKGRKAKPLVLLAERPEDGMYLVGAYNCMEKSGTVANNKFGRRFEIAARQCGGGEEKVMRERFDDFVVEVPRKTVQNFVQQLHVIMEQ
jgi:cell division control protein 45